MTISQQLDRADQRVGEALQHLRTCLVEVEHGYVCDMIGACAVRLHKERDTIRTAAEAARAQEKQND